MVQVGDLVKVVSNVTCHDFEIGQTVSVTEVNDGVIGAKDLSTLEQWWMQWEDFEELNPTPDILRYEFSKEEVEIFLRWSKSVVTEYGELEDADVALEDKLQNILKA